MLLATYLGLLLFTATPACQRWLAGKVGDVLSDELQTTVRLGNARIGLFNRLIIDDLLLEDQQTDTLLFASRLSAKINLAQLIRGRVRIGNVQLFGYDINLRQRAADKPYNFQFVVDKLSNPESDDEPVNLRISSFIVRRGSLRHHIDYEPFTNHFTPAHFELQDLSIKGEIHTIEEDSINVNISELRFFESINSLRLDNLRGKFISSAQKTLISDVSISLEHSEISLPMIRLDGPIDQWQDANGTAYISGRLTPSDLKMLVPQLASIDQPFTLRTSLIKRARQLQLSTLTLETGGFALDATARAQINWQDTTLSYPIQSARVDVRHLRASHSFLQSTLAALSQPSASPILTPAAAQTIERLGDVQFSGLLNSDFQKKLLTSQVQLTTSLGSAKLSGQLANDDAYQFNLQTTDWQLASLFDTPEAFPINDLSLTADLRGSVQHKTSDGTIQVQGLSAFGTRIDHIQSTIALTPRQIRSTTTVEDDDYSFRFSTHVNSELDLAFDVHQLNLLKGTVSLEDLHIRKADKTYDLRQLQLAMTHDDASRHLLLQSDFIDAHVDGHFRYDHLLPMAQHLMHQAMPSLVEAPCENMTADAEQVTFHAQFWDIEKLLNILDIDMELPQAGSVNGSIDLPRQRMSLTADLPHFIYASQHFKDSKLTFRQFGDSLSAELKSRRLMEEGPVDFALNTFGRNDHLTSTIQWDNHDTPSQRGEVFTQTHFLANENHQLAADMKMLKGHFVLSDTIWNVHESNLLLRQSVADIRGFEISQAGRHLRVHGRISQNDSDTLYADLKGINLSYIFELIDFHDLEFEGLATGKVQVHDLSKDFAVDAKLEVKDFAINGGLLGTLQVTGGFGRKDHNAIDLDAYIQEPEHHQISHILGLIKPGHQPGRGLELDIQAQHLNTYFINDFTKSIFTDLQGHASGYAYLHGPFRQLDLEGELAMDDAALTIDVLNTRYHVEPGDSVHLTKDGIQFRNVRVHDMLHDAAMTEPNPHSHNGVLNGELHYQHFKNINYTFDIEAQNFLGYNFREFGDQNFYGTVYADGRVHIEGKPGTLQVDVTCQPTSGTTFTYNASSPEAKTDNAFITFKSSSPTPQRESLASPNSSHPTEASEEKNEESDNPMDIFINFDINVTPAAQMRLLMDARTDDYINLAGNGNIRAYFHNKGRFQMYGTYHLDHGTYKLSLQDVIHKEFRFMPGGTIVFGGSPMKGELNMQAVYTVPSVSLNDLASGSNFSSSNVRVNCLMNITGRAEQPQVSFDFDIPNVNEDEKQMVRSLISTEEERNLQVVYLLGIGRFYSYALDTGRSQTNAAMQGLLSSTLSGQINELLSNMIGNGNWNFGTSLTTGDMGWNEVDVEGMLSGRLLNNRLLINGTFGYRDTPMANTNFIGDFDVQWLLTPSGNVRLKAYSETNDRYFTKTALTTQGIGIQVKKDFKSLGELFRKSKAE